MASSFLCARSGRVGESRENSGCYSGRVGERAQHGALYSHMRYNGAYKRSKAFYMQGIKVYAHGIASRLQCFTGLF